MKKRFLVHGANALLVSIASVGIAVVGYILVDRYRPFRVDMTASGLYELSPRTLDILESMPADVTVTYFEFPPSEEAGFVNTRVEELLEEYKVRSRGKLSYEIVNALREPLLFEELDGDYGSTIFQRGDDKVVVLDKEIFQASFDHYEESGPAVKFTGEEAFSSALVRLGEGGSTAACFLSGHGELSIEDASGAGYSGLAETLRSSNFTSRTVTLASVGGSAPASLDAPIALDEAPAAVSPAAEVPADCAVLVIAGPRTGAFSDAEIDAIDAHFEKGRGVVLLAEPLMEARTDVLARRLGAEMLPGVVLDPKRMVQSPLNIVPDWKPRHAITETMIAAEVLAVLPDTAAFRMPDEPDEGLTLSPFLTSGPSSLVVVDIQDGRADPTSEKNIDGPAVLAYAVEKTLADAKVARAILIGDADFASNAILETFAGGNLLLAENAVTWAAGGRKKLDIGPKDPGLARIGPELTDRGALWILFSTALMLPAAIFSTGVFVWVRRRGR